MRFFLIVFFASFAYYALPGYLLPILTFFSWACWVWPHSITAQQVGSGYHGLGVGAFTLDWAGISAYHGSPLVAPWASIANTAVGFVMFIYVIVPLCYWQFNTFDARRFPIFSNQLFTAAGQKYDTTKVLTKDLDLNVAAYDSYGKLYLSPLFAISIGSGFLRFTATIVHVLLFHGSDMWKQSRSAMNAAKLDVHAKLMQRYKQVPQWWFLVLLLGSVVVSLLMSLVWKEEVQLPWWGMLFAFALAFVFKRTKIGLVLRMVGDSADAARAMGYDIARVRVLATAFGGFMAGVGGAYLSLFYPGSWNEGISSGQGLIAVALVIFARWNPIACLVAALIFGGAGALGPALQSVGISQGYYLFYAAPYVLTLLILVLTSSPRGALDGAPRELSITK